MSSTKEGNPPMAMKVKNEDTNMISEPLAWKKNYNVNLAFELILICIINHMYKELIFNISLLKITWIDP